MVTYTFVDTRKSIWNLNSKTLNLDRPQHDRPAACVIAQQYSPAALVSLRVYLHKEEFDAYVFFLLP
jgi:hypothetical protein